MIRLDAFRIEGGVPLRGTVSVSGAKNAALPCLFASLLTDEPFVLENVPNLKDIQTAVALLSQLGKKVTFRAGRVHITAQSQLHHKASYDLVRKMRASVVVMGPLLARLGRAHVSLPGGCSIGARPVNYHIQAFEKMGVSVDLQEGYMDAHTEELHGAQIKLEFASVGATENVLMAAALAKGKTTLLNAAREPEIVDLANCLKAMGASIRGAGTSKIIIQGVERLSGCRHHVIPDRIEAGTFIIAAAITKGRLKIQNAEPDHLEVLIKQLREAGLSIQTKGKTIDVLWKKTLKPCPIRTRVYPGFPTDMQAQWMALMTLTPGVSRIQETVFENRFLHAQELTRMGASISFRGHTATVRGVDHLSACPVMVSDLRAGAALVLAGLAAKGVTKVLRVYHLDRGYDSLEKKLRKAGARIRRIQQ